MFEGNKKVRQFNRYLVLVSNTRYKLVFLEKVEKCSDNKKTIFNVFKVL